ncbi:MAG: DUF4105 domain-containing protein, partial [Deltaproteobacteria bacterium]|nr:DUF4105 domain-containing protein [Deltaproteobacteria bacterium]
MRLVALVCLFFFAAPASARATELDPSKIDRVAASKHWLRLLHYKTSWFLKTRSLVDGPEFFFSPTGKTDAKAELLATVEAFSKDIKTGRLKQHPQCAFPERFRYLKRELAPALDAIKTVACPLLDEYVEKFHAKSATLVFSSAFPNNPGSMFGHTFLRINSTESDDKKKKNDLLDYGISYAASVPPTDNGFQFAILGMGGGYLGAFTVMPYYAKVNEYSNSESRDLWEYDLDLTPAQTETIVRHVWELETNSWFDYYFFDENCSYILLSLLEVARDDWDLTDFAIYVIPGETVKKIAQVPGAVVDVKFRPSLRKRLFQKLAVLSAAERQTVFDTVAGKVSADKLSDTRTLESVTAYLFYLKQKASQKLSDDQNRILQTALLRRSELGVATNDAALPEIRPDSRPDL